MFIIFFCFFSLNILHWPSVCIKTSPHKPPYPLFTLKVKLQISLLPLIIWRLMTHAQWSCKRLDGVLCSTLFQVQTRSGKRLHDLSLGLLVIFTGISKSSETEWGFFNGCNYWMETHGASQSKQHLFVFSREYFIPLLHVAFSESSSSRYLTRGHGPRESIPRIQRDSHSVPCDDKYKNALLITIRPSGWQDETLRANSYSLFFFFFSFLMVWVSSRVRTTESMLKQDLWL